MADFPSQVTTGTGAPSSHQGGTSGVDMSFLGSVPAILMMVEIGLGLLHWALVASVGDGLLGVYGWVLFVAVTLWILTTLLFLMILLGVQRRLTSVPWPLTVMAYHGVATLLYITAFLAHAASVHPYHYSFYVPLAFGAFFGAVVTLAYGGSAFFSYLDWRGDGGNAATSTVPT